MIYNHGLFQGFDGHTLFEQSWMPESNCKAIVLLVHGLAEHSGRYEHVAEFLTSHNIGLETFDLKGHGKSDGRRAYIGSFDEHLLNLDIFVKRIQERQPDKAIFLYGHSMGATISTLYEITRETSFKGLIVSGVVVKVSADISPMLIKMSAILSRYAPRMKVTKLDSASISRDPLIIKDYDEDPLNYRGGIPARMGYELIVAINRIQAQMKSITLPILIMHGSCDKLSDPAGSRELVDGVSSKDKTLKIYNGFYHEIHNDPEKQKVFDDIVKWIDAHI